MEPQNIKRVLRDVLKQSGIDKKIEECRVLLLWDEAIAGASSLSARTEPVGITQGRMAVNVTDSVTLHQLTLYKKRYIDRINQLSGDRVVKDIVFRVGKVEKRRRQTGERQGLDDYIKRFQNVQLDQDELTRIDELVARIEDEELRNSLKEFFVNQSKLFKIREQGRGV